MLLGSTAQSEPDLCFGQSHLGGGRKVWGVGRACCPVDKQVQCPWLTMSWVSSIQLTKSCVSWLYLQRLCVTSFQVLLWLDPCGRRYRRTIPFTAHSSSECYKRHQRADPCWLAAVVLCRMLCLAQKCSCNMSGSMSTCVCKGACNFPPAQLFIACAVPPTASYAFGLWPCFLLGSAPCLQLPHLLQPSPPTSTRMLAQVPSLR